MWLALTAGAGLAVLWAGEQGMRRGWFSGERARKFSHILIGSLAASWPFYLHWYEIRLISAALVVGVGVSIYFGWFGATRSVRRRTYGEALFAAVIGLLTLVTDSPGLYAVAMLHLGLADGAAAVAGSLWGRRNSYRVYGATKSLAGSLAFVCISVGLILGYAAVSGVFIPLALVAGVALGAALLENVGAYGLDNVLVPVFVAAVLSMAHMY